MEIVELVLDEKDDEAGVYAISIVGDPAIEANFISLSKDNEVRFEKVDEDKRILRGPVLIPNKMIYRRQGDREYNVFFSQDTIRKTSEMFFKNKAQDKSTLEHKLALNGMTVVESWIVEDPEKDKSAIHNFGVPQGTWMASIKVDNDEVWQDIIKTGKAKGFSIEGYFAEKTELSSEDTLKSKLKKLLEKYDKVVR